MKCSVEDCEREVKYTGLCGMHYKRKWRWGDPNTTQITMHKGEACSVEGCDNPATDKDMCKNCAQRFRRFGRTYNVVNRGSGWWYTAADYIEILVDGRRVLEHVYLAEQALGKPLPKGTIVHHMNKIPFDNHTPLNLIVCPNQAYHLLLHRRAKELGYE